MIQSSQSTHVRRGPERLEEVVVVLSLLRETKVRNLDDRIRRGARQQQILRLAVRQTKRRNTSIQHQSTHLDVAMHDVFLVHVLESQQGLADHVRGLVFTVLLELDNAIEQFTTSNPTE